MLFTAAVVLLLPLSLADAQPDRLTDLVERMRLLTLAGDYAAVGRLVPGVLEELAKGHPKAAIAWNQVGVHFQDQGNYGEAEQAYQRGIRLAEKEGNSAGDLETLLLNLSSLYLLTGQRPAETEVICRRALKNAIALYGPNSPELTTFLYALGSAQLQLGDRKDARRLYLQALDLAGDSREGKLRQGHVLASLAYLFALDKQWVRAKESFLQSIVLLDAVLGPSHPDSVRTHVNLAVIYVQLKQWTLASASLARAREITEARLGGTHPLMADILITSASIMRKTGHGREARELNRRAKAIAAAQPKRSTSEGLVHVADLVRR